MPFVSGPEIYIYIDKIKSFAAKHSCLFSHEVHNSLKSSCRFFEVGKFKAELKPSNFSSFTSHHLIFLNPVDQPRLMKESKEQPLQETINLKPTPNRDISDPGEVVGAPTSQSWWTNTRVEETESSLWRQPGLVTRSRTSPASLLDVAEQLGRPTSTFTIT